MGQIKRFAEEVSVELGFGGEINDRVLAEARSRFESELGEVRKQEYTSISMNTAAIHIKDALNNLSDTEFLKVLDSEYDLDVNEMLIEALRDKGDSEFVRILREFVPDLDEVITDYIEDNCGPEDIAEWYKEVVPGVKDVRYDEDNLNEERILFRKIKESSKNSEEGKTFKKAVITNDNDTRWRMMPNEEVEKILRVHFPSYVVDRIIIRSHVDYWQTINFDTHEGMEGDVLLEFEDDDEGDIVLMSTLHQHCGESWTVYWFTAIEAIQFIK